MGVIYILWIHALQIYSCSLSFDEQKFLRFSVFIFFFLLVWLVLLGLI